MFASPKSQSLIGLLAAVALSGCMVSENPAVNTLATAAAIGGAMTLFYNLSDGYYYDRDYKRLPRDYQPDRNARIRRVDNIDNYRRDHPRAERRMPDNGRHSRYGRDDYRRDREDGYGYY